MLLCAAERDRGAVLAIADFRGGGSARCATKWICDNLAEVDYHDVYRASIWPQDSVAEYARQGHDAHHHPDRSARHPGGHDLQSTDYDGDDEEHSCPNRYDPGRHDDEYHACRGQRRDDRARNDDVDNHVDNHDDNHDGSGHHDDNHVHNHDNNHDGSGDHWDRDRDRVVVTVAG